MRNVYCFTPFLFSFTVDKLLAGADAHHYTAEDISTKTGGVNLQFIGFNTVLNVNANKRSTGSKRGVAIAFKKLFIVLENFHQLSLDTSNKLISRADAKSLIKRECVKFQLVFLFYRSFIVVALMSRLLNSDLNKKIIK